MTSLGMNAAFAGVTNLLGIRNDPYLGFNFLVEIEGLVVGGFSEVTGLQIETVLETYREGGVNEFEHKLAGPTRYPSNLILKRGLTPETERVLPQEGGLPAGRRGAATCRHQSGRGLAGATCGPGSPTPA